MFMPSFSFSFSYLMLNKFTHSVPIFDWFQTLHPYIPPYGVPTYNLNVNYAIISMYHPMPRKKKKKKEISPIQR